MVSQTKGVLPANQEERHSFEERVKLGAENAVRCMGVNAQDRVVILTDYEREGIARHVAAAALARRCSFLVPPRASAPREAQKFPLNSRPATARYANK